MPALKTKAINLALLGQTRIVVRLQRSDTTLPPLSVGETAESEPLKGEQLPPDGGPMGVNEGLTPGHILPVSAAADKKDSAAAVHVLGWRTSSSTAYDKAAQQITFAPTEARTTGAFPPSSRQA